MTSVFVADFIIEREGRAIEPGSGRHRKVVEPSLARLAVRHVRAQLRRAR